ncbi:MAG: LysR family transcriptional regulator [Nitratireductor sp.]
MSGNSSRGIRAQMNWDDYRHFLAVARTGRLSLAAKQLGVDHATVGRRIKALETALGANLFDKSPQGYALTDTGQRLVDVAESMETAAIGAAADIGGKDAVISGTVRIGAPEGVAATVLAGYNHHGIVPRTSGNWKSSWSRCRAPFHCRSVRLILRLRFLLQRPGD